MATGHGNQLTDDVELDLRDTDGPVDVAIGDHNAQQAVEDDSTRTEDSFDPRDLHRRLPQRHGRGQLRHDDERRRHYVEDRRGQHER